MPYFDLFTSKNCTLKGWDNILEIKHKENQGKIFIF